MEEAVLCEQNGAVLNVTLNRPHVMNALNSDVTLGIHKAIDMAVEDESIRVVVLSGTDGNFCAGADMEGLNTKISAPDWLMSLKQLGKLIRTIRTMQKILVCKVTGFAVGAGANIALSGDFVIASNSARFCEIFVNIGVVMDGGGTYFLPRLVGLPKARELAMLGEMVDGPSAAAMGLIYRSFPDEDLDKETDNLVDKLLAKSTMVLGLLKQGIETSLNQTLDEVLEWEASHQAIMLQSEDHKKAVKAFLESRKKK